MTIPNHFCWKIQIFWWNILIVNHGYNMCLMWFLMFVGDLHGNITWMKTWWGKYNLFTSHKKNTKYPKSITLQSNYVVDLMFSNFNKLRWTNYVVDLMFSNFNKLRWTNYVVDLMFSNFNKLRWTNYVAEFMFSNFRLEKS